jgi:hypothetical protein
MKDPYDMDCQEFKNVLATLTTPSEIWDNAPNIYQYLTQLFETDCRDSLLREWAFQWWSDKMESPYELIYNKWIN